MTYQMVKAKPNNTQTAPRTTDITRGSAAEAEPIYNASVGEPLLTKVEWLFLTKAVDAMGVELLCGMTPAVMVGLEELPTKGVTDPAVETEELSGCKVKESAASEDAVATGPVFSDADEEETTGTTDMPRVLVRIFLPAV
jgi:hypothetical protein